MNQRSLTIYRSQCRSIGLTLFSAVFSLSLIAQTWNPPSGPFLDPPFEFFGPGLEPRYVIHEVSGSVVPDPETVFYIFEDFNVLRAYGGDAPAGGVLANHRDYEVIAANWKGQLFDALYVKFDYAPYNNDPNAYSDVYHFFTTPTSGVFIQEAYESTASAKVAGTFTIDGSLPEPPEIRTTYHGTTHISYNALQRLHSSNRNFGFSYELFFDDELIHEGYSSYEYYNDFENQLSQAQSKASGLRTSPVTISKQIRGFASYLIPSASRWNPNVYTLGIDVPDITLDYTENWTSNISPIGDPGREHIPLYTAANRSYYKGSQSGDKRFLLEHYDSDDQLITYWDIELPIEVDLKEDQSFFVTASGNFVFVEKDKYPLRLVQYNQLADSFNELLLIPEDPLNCLYWYARYTFRESTQSIILIFFTESDTTYSETETRYPGFPVYEIPLTEIGSQDLISRLDDYLVLKLPDVIRPNTDSANVYPRFISWREDHGLLVDYRVSTTLVNFDTKEYQPDFIPPERPFNPDDAPGWNDLRIWDNQLVSAEGEYIAHSTVISNELGSYSPLRILDVNNLYVPRAYMDDLLYRNLIKYYHTRFTKLLSKSVYFPKSEAVILDEIKDSISPNAVIFDSENAQIFNVHANRTVDGRIKSAHSWTIIDLNPESAVKYHFTPGGDPRIGGINSPTTGFKHFRMESTQPNAGNLSWDFTFYKTYQDTPLPNDEWVNAIPITASTFSFISGNNLQAATLSAGERDLGLNRKSVWYKWTPTKTGWYVNTVNSEPDAAHLFKKADDGNLYPIEQTIYRRFFELIAGEPIYVPVSDNRIIFMYSGNGIQRDGFTGNSRSIGDDWWSHPSLGNIQVESYPWIYFEHKGWIRVEDVFYSDAKGKYFYAADSQSWFWASDYSYPYVYNAKENQWELWD